MFLTTRSALVLGLVSLPLAASSTVPVLDIHYIFPSERKFKLKEDIVGHKFYDAFNFQTFNDPTHGRVDYVDQSYASSRNLTYTSDSKFVMRADTSKVVTKQSRGRESIRIASKQKYEDSVIVLDMTHMPTGCATWPAFWTVTSEGRWPKGGEIDIIEGVNLQSRNLASLHTTAGCTMSEYRPRLMTGKAKSNECDASKNYNQGCGVDFSRPKSYGKDFNKYGGGWFAMSRTKEDGISVWFWSRDDPTVPDDVRRGGKTVCTDTWGLPEAVFTPDNCDMKSHFGPHEIVFDLTFCGDWAGSLYPTSGCPGSCVDFVDNNPKEFLDAYWEINSLRTYV